MDRRNLDIAVLSDIHLGTYGCHSREVLQYLKSIRPKTLILNGDIIDIWNFKKRYFPKEHLRVIYEIIKMSQKKTKVYYITGNHDDLLRQFSDSKFGSIELVNKLAIILDGKKYWFFHGDIFDASINHAKWLAKLGGKGYDLLILINRMINKLAVALGKKPMSLSRKIKNNVKKAVKFVNDFEQTAVDLAVENHYDFVVCGHIHQALIKEYHSSDKSGKVTYMNSGDWVENLTALEYTNNDWQLYRYEYDTNIDNENSSDLNLNGKQDIKLDQFPKEFFNLNFSSLT